MKRQTQICLFLKNKFLCVCMCVVYAFVNAGVRVPLCRWRSEDNLWYHTSPSNLFERRSLVCCSIGQVGWPMSFRDSPISASYLVIGTEITAANCFYLAFRDPNSGPHASALPTELSPQPKCAFLSYYYIYYWVWVCEHTWHSMNGEVRRQPVGIELSFLANPKD